MLLICHKSIKPTIHCKKDQHQVSLISPIVSLDNETGERESGKTGDSYEGTKRLSEKIAINLKKGRKKEK